MASYNKYQDFAEQLFRGKHDFNAHIFKVALSNGTPDPTHTTRSAISELITANGYTTGGNASTMLISMSAGTATVIASDPAVWTSSGVGITFRYAALYNDTATSPADALVAYWDYGSSVTVPPGGTLQLDLGTTLFTLV